ncbi:hypothetical protein [Rhizobium alvei]|uniref:Uncharacterized protein n=2 Tax=Rhizobium alvei TaxID=1132659 RepID=A0ABT8YII2_9HYPH|nr:hypothetical protein [Rhizobium alvei]MDO6963485.1 hypothetical protein [Rhizobium alvei]
MTFTRFGALAIGVAIASLLAVSALGWSVYGSSILLDMAAGGLSWCL